MAFQARILNEEWARRETLERLQEEQKSMLEHERKKREEFERQQNEKETQLRGEGAGYRCEIHKGPSEGPSGGGYCPLRTPPVKGLRPPVVGLPRLVGGQIGIVLFWGLAR